jgi:hypothetical protein
VERLVAGFLAAVAGGGIGVGLSRFLWNFAGAKVECDLGPGGHCPGPGDFLPFGLVGGALGILITLLGLIGVVRTLNEERRFPRR